MFNYQTDRTLRDEAFYAREHDRILNELTDRLAAENTLTGRGFTRRVDGREVYRVRVPVECLREDRWRPVVWLAITVGCVGTLAALALFARDILAAGIALGDLLGLTAR